MLTTLAAGVVGSRAAFADARLTEQADHVVAENCRRADLIYSFLVWK